MKPQIEIFQTNVSDPSKAQIILNEIETTYPKYEVNFDLEDCDRILRVSSLYPIDMSGLQGLLKHFDVTSEVLV